MKVILACILSMTFILTGFHSKAQLDVEKLIQFDELKGTPIRDILPDREGNIWIATQSGLVKFDGYKFTRFHPDPTDTTTMGELLTYVLYEDRDGNIWIGSQDAVYRYNPEYSSFKRFTYRELLGMRDGYMANILTIADNNRGRIYFGAYTQILDEQDDYRSKGLFYYDEAKEAMLPFELPAGIDLYTAYLMSTGPDNNIWIFGNSGFYKLDTLNQLVNIPCPDDEICLEDGEYITGMDIDSSGYVWFVSSLSKIRKYDPKKDQVELVDLDIPLTGNIFNIYSDMLIDDQQDIWFATQQGLIHFDRKKSITEVLDPGSKDRLYRDMTTALAADGFGNLWIGTESVGLLKYNSRNLLGSFVWDDNDPTTITSGWVFRMFENKQGEVWVGTRGAGENAGISRIDFTNNKAYPYLFDEIAPGTRVFDLYMGITPGKMLLWTNHGVKNLDYRNMTLQDTVVELLNDTTAVNNVIRDSRGNIWYCSYTGLFKQSAKTGDIHHFNLMNLSSAGANSNSVTNLYESPIHGLWILTDDGLFLYDYDSRDISRHGYDTETGAVFPVQDFNSVYESPDGICWVGTWQGGLCRYNVKTGEIKTYTSNDGLPSMSIQGILGDEKNDALWLSTFAGISRFNLDDEQFNNFSLKDGIQGLLYADGQYLKTSSGYCLFGGNNGVTFFKPDDIAENAMPPITYITRFHVGEQSVSIGQGYKDISPFKLSHDQNNISIDYTGIQYDDPLKNKFAYLLENFDKTWREVDNQQSAYYYNLPPGKYIFKVKAANSHGVWNKEPVSLSFMIRPPWWKTWWAYAIYAIIFITFIIVFDRTRRKRLLEKERQLAKEKELAQAKEIEKAYTELKATQKQLIHSEKMASLGELTAGIAHEIQNPLNFVNNFSEVNLELANELKDGLKKGDIDEADAIASDIIQNEQKINQHGKRADAIVKSMLQHSRTSSGQKEPTDINALADEYLRLSFHGLRAKDKSFNADFKLETDPELPKVNVVSQDIGRVLLNLINNAFYAVAEKAKQIENSFTPLVVISTLKENDKVKITISDNGNGIPDAIKDKIFQPFFTTKPTGQGTGLGLSMSYDIITKGHGGNLKMKSDKEKGTEFIIELPIQN
ncbi:MAG: hypothetical protein KQI35_01530 [Bacteroidetes bacterium]|nr:hypothetical protein [Bacteroidota bacterium]